MLVINTGIKKYKSVIKKKKKLDQIVLLGKSKLDNIEALISNTEKLMKIKGDVKWKGYNNLLNSWINKKDIV